VSKKGTPLKSGYFFAIGLSNVKMFPDSNKHAAYHNKQWSRTFWNVNIDNLE